ncbi:MAG: extracellular solute-binding protein [Treponema sp.]|jgi:putative aldouronate transport system substrate-binding protein|nr:extracellular solute-binding protein [Treponema sp.]
MKKLMVLLLSVFVVASVFAGGSSASSSGGTSTGGGQKYTSLPFVTDGTKLTVYVGEATNNEVTSFDPKDNIFTAKVIKDTGINLEIITGEDSSGLSVLLNTGNYPDVIISSMSYNDLLYYAGQGILRPLDEFNPLSSPNIKAAFDEYPALNQILRGADGKLYALPTVNDCLHCIYSGGRAWYYMPWMRDNNIKQPQTLDEFTSYLRYVKTNDLNKNGKQDEIPIAFDAEGARNFIAYIAKAYLPFVMGNYYGLAVENGKIVEQYKDPRFREALKYLAGIYKEGLILSDSFTMSGDQMRGLAESPDPVVAIEGITWMNSYTTHPSIRGTEKFVLPAIQGPNGQRNASNSDPWSILSAGYMITDKCKDPALAIALYNYFINFEIEMDGYLGPKGTAWDYADPGTSSIIGQASHKILWTFGQTPVNTSWGQGNPMIRNSKFRLGEQATGIDAIQKWYDTGDPSLQQQVLAAPAYKGEALWYITSMQLSKYKMSDSLFIPPMAVNDADNARLADINALLETYKDQAMVEFITGSRNIDNNTDWNTYLSELDRLGAAEMVQIRQKYLK